MVGRALRVYPVVKRLGHIPDGGFPEAYGRRGLGVSFLGRIGGGGLVLGASAGGLGNESVGGGGGGFTGVLGSRIFGLGEVGARKGMRRTVRAYRRREGELRTRREGKRTWFGLRQPFLQRKGS